MKRINLTQHESTPEQDCIPRSDELASAIKGLLTFHELPTMREIVERAQALAEIAHKSGAQEAMIGGAPYLMEALAPALRMAGIVPVYAFSLRESVDEKQADGSVIKRTVFRHAGFVRMEQ